MVWPSEHFAFDPDVGPLFKVMFRNGHEPFAKNDCTISYLRYTIEDCAIVIAHWFNFANIFSSKVSNLNPLTFIDRDRQTTPRLGSPG